MFIETSFTGGNGSARRKRFKACNHLGFGKFCHRCDLAERLKEELNDVKSKEATALRQSQRASLSDRIAKLLGSTKGSPATLKEVAPMEIVGLPDVDSKEGKEIVAHLLSGGSAEVIVGPEDSERTKMERIMKRANDLAEG